MMISLDSSKYANNPVYTNTPMLAYNKMERTDAYAGYRNTHYRNGGYDSAKKQCRFSPFPANKCSQTV